jgi:hypothetical protein
MLSSTATINNIVANDDPITFTPASTSVHRQVSDTLAFIASQREQWETGAYRRSNEELYSILQNCYAVDYAISTAEVGVADMRKAITDYAAHLGFSFKEGTPVINRIVRCVFGNVQRSRISTYSLVLREAKKQNVAIENIPQFIEQAGGVQEIRLSKSATYTSPKEKAELARSTAFTESLAVAKSSNLSKLADSALANTRCVLLATQLPDGSFAINSVVRSEGAIKAALVSHYTQNKSVLRDAASKQEAANDSQVRNSILQRIVSN